MTGDKLKLVRRVMGSSQIFCSTVNDMLEAALTAVGDSTLALSQLELMALIARSDSGFKVSDVAEFMGVTNAAASRAIDRLVQRGLVDRAVAPRDRRAVELSLTPEGQDLLDRVMQASDRKLMEALGDYPAERLMEASQLLESFAIRLLEADNGSERTCLRCGVHFREGCAMRQMLGRACIFYERMNNGGPEVVAVSG